MQRQEQIDFQNMNSFVTTGELSGYDYSPSSKVSSRVDGLMSDPPTRMLSMAHCALSRLGVARPEEIVNGCHQRRRVALVRAPSGRTI